MRKSSVVAVETAGDGPGRSARKVIVIRIVFVASLVALGLVAGLEAGWWNDGELSRGSTAVESGGFVTGLTRYERATRQQVPGVKGTTLDGGALDLADLRGKVVVVNVWASWCSPCRAEAGDLARVARDTDDGQVRFVGIDTRDNDAAARAFVRTFKVPYPSIVDTDGQVLLAFNKLLPTSAVPSTLVVDRDARIAARVIGRISYPTLRGLVQDAVAEPKTSAQAGPR